MQISNCSSHSQIDLVLAGTRLRTIADSAETFSFIGAGRDEVICAPASASTRARVPSGTVPFQFASGEPFFLTKYPSVRGEKVGGVEELSPLNHRMSAGDDVQAAYLCQTFE